MNQPIAIPEVEYEKITLDNGLDVIFHVDRKLPIVHVNQWFHVGSKNERPGRTGFAHLFEHLMFEGSTNAPEGYFAYIEKAGGNLREGGVNGTTSHDRTNYFATVPSGNLEHVLWLESDRVATLADALTSENFENQREVVRNERRQGLENQPYGQWTQLVCENLYPSGHPYSWPVIGSHEDLEAATLEDVRTFFQTYYTPNNLSLVIAGDLDIDQAKRMVESYYGGIPAGPRINRPTRWISHLSAEKTVNVPDAVPQVRTYTMWPVPSRFEDAEVPLDLASSLLSDGLSSRLKKSLVYDSQLCTDIMAFNMSKEISGMFVTVASVRPGASVEAVEQEIDDQLHRLASEGPTEDELQRVKTSWEYRFVSGLERIGGFGGKADKLNESNTFRGDPGYFQTEYDSFTNTTADQIKDAVGEWVDTKNRLVIRFLPETQRKASSTTIDRSVKPLLGEDTPFRSPDVKSETLPNGLEVYVVERRDLPKVAVTLAVRSGSVHDESGKSGAAHVMMTTIDKGTQTRDALEIADELGNLGSGLSATVYRESSALSFESLTRNLSGVMDIFSDVVRNPLFPETEIEREVKRNLDLIDQRKANAQSLAGRLIPSLAFGRDHVYGRPVQGDQESMNLLERLDVMRSHDMYWGPKQAALIFAGDISMDDATVLARTHLGDWTGEDLAAGSVDEPSPIGQGQLYIVDRPGNPQTVVSQILAAPKRTTPEYYALRLADTIWGGGFESRLNRNLREDKGLTYGIFSSLSLNRFAGTWCVQSAVDGDRTGEALSEIVSELDGISGQKPITEEELVDARTNLVRGYAQQFESVRRIGGQVAGLWSNRLPMVELRRAIDEIAEATLDDVNEAAQKYTSPEQATYLLVGDRSVIEPQINESFAVQGLTDDGRTIA
jgi:zinc protease